MPKMPAIRTALTQRKARKSGEPTDDAGEREEAEGHVQGLQGVGVLGADLLGHEDGGHGGQEHPDGVDPLPVLDLADVGDDEFNLVRGR